MTSRLFILLSHNKKKKQCIARKFVYDENASVVSHCFIVIVRKTTTKTEKTTSSMYRLNPKFKNQAFCGFLFGTLYLFENLFTGRKKK